jgi:transposase-like protein
VLYSQGFKEQAVRRLLEGKSANALANEMEVAQTTLSRWLREALKKAELGAEDSHVKIRTPEEKLRLIMQVEALPESERGGLLRREGVHASQLAEWRRAASSGLQRTEAHKGRDLSSKRIKELERELARKEKALAEVTALLVLKKKVEAIWGEEDDSTRQRKER